jgi:NAD(P)-dependent dehydrogenase (short-subunit alcohol dehydrogenase family)
VKTIVITGGTDGIGRHLADTYVKRGDRVIVIGRDAGKGGAFLTATGERAVFRQADLSVLADNRAVIDELLATCPRVDALVLCARSYRSWRTETPDGIEATFAHFYLSRFLFCHGLRNALEQSDSPVIVNVAGPGGDLSLVHWDDLQLARGYDGGAALGQGGKLNDLLGVSFAGQYPDGKTRYVLIHPGVTATAQVGEYDPRTLAMVEQMRRHGKPVLAAAEPIIALIDSPPTEPLSALVEGRPVGVSGRGFDPTAARELDRMTRALLGELPKGGSSR